VAAERLAVAASKAEQQHEQRKEREETGAALTNVLPAIAPRGPRKVA
jgi:hypothetical protein